MAQTIYALLLEQCNAVLKQAQERIIFSTVWAQLILVIKCILWPTKFFGHTVSKLRRKFKKKSKLGSSSILIMIKWMRSIHQMYLGMYHMGNLQMAHMSCVFSKENYHKNIKKLPSKVANNCLGRAVFSTASRPKTSPNLKFCSIQMPHCATYI